MAAYTVVLRMMIYLIVFKSSLGKYLRNKPIKCTVLNICVSFMMKLLSLCYHGNPNKETTLIMRA